MMSQTFFRRLLRRGSAFVLHANLLISVYAQTTSESESFTLDTGASTGARIFGSSDFFILDTRAVEASGPVKIREQPTGAPAIPGLAVKFRVKAEGLLPLNYQWLFNDKPIEHAENKDTFDISSVTSADAGYYSVVISNPLGSRSSLTVPLIVFNSILTSKPEVPETLRTDKTPTSALTAAPERIGSSFLKVLLEEQKIDRQKKTIILTHGWRRDSSRWPLEMAETLRKQHLDETVNILAWDWRENARRFPPNIAANFTRQEGEELGAEIMKILGENYSEEIHFMGHSLGTLVNCWAADFLHGEYQTSPGYLKPFFRFDWRKTHITLFDEAELQEALESLDVFAATLLPTLSAVNAIARIPDVKVIPGHSIWIDNYISAVGLLHSQAVNLLLWREFDDPVGLHGYSYRWYQNSIGNPTGTLDTKMGFRNSFEFGDFFPNNAPKPGDCFIQSLDLSKSPLAVTKVPEFEADLFSRFRIPVYTSLQTYKQVTRGAGVLYGGTKRIVNATGTFVYDKIQYVGDLSLEVYEFVTADNSQQPPKNIPVFSGTALSTPAYFTTADDPVLMRGDWQVGFKIKTTPQLESSKNLKTSVSSNQFPMFAWVPVEIPSNATWFSIEFNVQASSSNSYVAFGLDSKQIFSKETKFLEPEDWYSCGLIKVAEFAGKKTSLFLSLNGNYLPEAKLHVRSIQFFESPAPMLTIRPYGVSSIISWPRWKGWQLQQTLGITENAEWKDVIETPVQNSFENVITNRSGDQTTFFRLRKE